LKTGIVYCSTGSWYLIKTADKEEYFCKIKGKFRNQKIKSTNPIVVGDKVDFIIEKGESFGVIQKIYNRKNYIIRKSVNLSKQVHILASNIDVAFLIITLKKPTTVSVFIDRILSTANAYQIPVILLFNKIDLYSKKEMEKVEELYSIYKKINYNCYKISALQNKNIIPLKEIMEKKSCLFLGHSGAGKSTLINRIDSKLKLKTAPISKTHQQGQHTTTFAQMFDIEKDIRIIDTPGIKGFGIVDITATELAQCFPGFNNLKEKCKFSDCLHKDEPNCYIKKAVEIGEISSSSYKNYLQILKNDKHYR